MSEMAREPGGSADMGERDAPAEDSIELDELVDDDDDDVVDDDDDNKDEERSDDEVAVDVGAIVVVTVDGDVANAI